MTKAVAELREHARVSLAPTMIRAEISREGAVREGYLVNVSLGGALLTMNDPPEKDERWDLYLLLPWGIGECRLSATCVWQQNNEESQCVGAGLSFDNLSADARAKLSRYLERFAELSGEITD